MSSTADSVVDTLNDDFAKRIAWVMKHSEDREQNNIIYGFVKYYVEGNCSWITRKKGLRHLTRAYWNRENIVEMMDEADMLSVLNTLDPAFHEQYLSFLDKKRLLSEAVEQAKTTLSAEEQQALVSRVEISLLCYYVGESIEFIDPKWIALRTTLTDINFNKSLIETLFSKDLLTRLQSDEGRVFLYSTLSSLINKKQILQMTLQDALNSVNSDNKRVAIYRSLITYYQDGNLDGLKANLVGKRMSKLSDFFVEYANLTAPELPKIRALLELLLPLAVLQSDPKSFNLPVEVVLNQGQQTSDAWGRTLRLPQLLADFPEPSELSSDDDRTDSIDTADVPLASNPLEGHNFFGEEDIPEEDLLKLVQPDTSSNALTMQILGVFCTVLGVAAVAIAFTALNAATFGIAGLTAACLGGLTLGLGLTLFSVGTWKACNNVPEQLVPPGSPCV